MFHIIYLSESSSEWTKEDLHKLLIKSRHNNHSAGISGMLIYKQHWFAQILEGPDAHVRRLFATISADPRHHHVEILASGPIDQRDFPDWSMGFHDLNETDVLGMYGDKKDLGRILSIESFRRHPSECLHVLRFIRDLHLTKR
jgi:hypothetical protein